jgi:hypothetical protein
MPCSVDAYHDLWLAFHANPFDQIYLPVKKLEEVITCHLDFHPQFDPKPMFVKTPSRTAMRALVRRDEAFRFLADHGKCACDNPKLQRKQIP